MICGTFKLGDQFTREVVFKMCGRLETNSFEIPLGHSSVSIQVSNFYAYRHGTTVRIDNYADTKDIFSLDYPVRVYNNQTLISL